LNEASLTPPYTEAYSVESVPGSEHGGVFRLCATCHAHDFSGALTQCEVVPMLRRCRARRVGNVKPRCGRAMSLFGFCGQGEEHP
jgi:hypothetical protein